MHVVIKQHHLSSVQATQIVKIFGNEKPGEVVYTHVTATQDQ